MTQAEYVRLYKLANEQAGLITNRTRKLILQAYKTAGRMASQAVIDTTAAGLSELTSIGWDNINNQLRAGANLISESVQLNTPEAISKAYKNYSKIDIGYIDDAINASGTSIITVEGFQPIIVGIDNALITATANRIYSDGFTFQDRIWKVFDLKGKPIGINGDYQYRIKNLILTGQAQGRDNIDIAKDIQMYISQGREAVFRPGRYGRLVPGTAEYKARISGYVDWRSLRLVRSEMHASLQMAGRLEGVMNPACRNLYDWLKTRGNVLDIDGSRNASGLRCIDLEDSNPYTLETAPSYQHPSCSCSLIPVLMDQNQFVDDLSNWDLGSGPAYLDEYYRNIYIPGQAA